MLGRRARAPWLLAAAHVAVLLALAGRYGFHRDELYFLEASRHLALGYVDQPPLVALLARAQVLLFGDSVAALRVLPALASGGSVLLAAVLARELGGGRRAQALAAGALAGATFVLTTGHLLSTATFDFLLWMAALCAAARLLRTADPRWWLAFGGVAGIALWNKHLIALLAIALVAGLMVERRFDLLSLRPLAAGATFAAVLAAPVLVWQAANGWPQLEMAQALSDRLGAENRLTLLPLQLVLLGPLLIPLAAVGVRWLWGHDDGRFRPLLLAYVGALLLTLVTGGRPYYPLPLAAGIVVAGCVAIETVAHRWAVGLLVANAVVSLPIALPVLPAVVLAATPIGDLNDTSVETIGWPELAADVAAVSAALPAPEQADVVLLTGSYGEAGALDHFGPLLGLPEVYSGHNSYWHWRRPPEDSGTVVAVRMPEAFLRRHFDDCRLAARVDNRVGIDNEAQGQPIWVCQGLRGSWAQAWPEFRHYN